ncbi:IS21 family transposase [candidate division WOR-3 bacterium]|nr:IS21 family transposase [candidate division WOR-3 bacterium]
MDEWFTIKTLKAKGVSIKKIARQLGLSRNTVRRYLRGEGPPRYNKQSRTNQAIRPYVQDIKLMLISEFIGSRIYHELQQKGYRGRPATFYRQLKLLREEMDLDPVRAVERFETAPGHQGQYDWSPYVIWIGGRLTRVYLHSFILGYSRSQHYYASLTVHQAAIFEALEDGFRHFNGVPGEVLIDNPKALVISPRPHLVFNPHLLAFAAHYGFQPRACWPGRARTKGKVERPFFFVEERFIKGKRFASLADFVAQLAGFEQTMVNQRVHGTTQERPVDRLAKEQVSLKPLPAQRFILPRQIMRKANWDGLISFDGSRYSVPWPYAGKMVWVGTLRGQELEIYGASGQLLARHDLSVKKGTVTLKKEHYAGLRRRVPQGKTMIVKVFKELFPTEQAALFLEKLFAQHKYHGQAQLRQILELARLYPRETMCRVFDQALTYNTYSANFLRGLLSQEIPSTTTITPPQPDHIASPTPYTALLQRSLEVYQTLVTGKEIP